ncbi:hypothetical protein ACRAWD_05975 [Caulobacter segnis]
MRRGYVPGLGLRCWPPESERRVRRRHRRLRFKAARPGRNDADYFAQRARGAPIQLLGSLLGAADLDKSIALDPKRTAEAAIWPAPSCGSRRSAIRSMGRPGRSSGRRTRTWRHPPSSRLRLGPQVRLDRPSTRPKQQLPDELRIHGWKVSPEDVGRAEAADTRPLLGAGAAEPGTGQGDERLRGGAARASWRSGLPGQPRPGPFPPWRIGEGVGRLRRRREGIAP